MKFIDVRERNPTEHGMYFVHYEKETDGSIIKSVCVFVGDLTPSNNGWVPSSIKVIDWLEE